MPTPNYGVPGSYANNYQVNFASPISANQGDIRLDKTISDKQSLFARFSYKNRQVLTAPSAACTFTYCAEAGSPLQGAYNTPEIDEGLTFAHNYVFSPGLMNEFRGGYNAQHTSEEQRYSTTSLLSQTGINVPQPDTAWSEAPQVLINGFMSTGAGNPGMQRGQIVQLIDNVTWISNASATMTTTSSATIAPDGMFSTDLRRSAKTSAIPSLPFCSAIPITLKLVRLTSPPWTAWDTGTPFLHRTIGR
jgi:hypothetical protein